MTTLKTIAVQTPQGIRKLAYDPATQTFDAVAGKVVPRVKTVRELLDEALTRIRALEATVAALKASRGTPTP